MLKLAPLLIFCLAKADFNLKTYAIPHTNYKIDVPRDWQECDKDNNFVLFCAKQFLPNLRIVQHKNSQAKTIYAVAKNKVSNKSNIKIYGANKALNAFWLDYSVTTNSKFRVFSTFTQIDPTTTLELTYTLVNQRVSGYILAKYQRSLLSLTKR